DAAEPPEPLVVAPALAPPAALEEAASRADDSNEQVESSSHRCPPRRRRAPPRVHGLAGGLTFALLVVSVSETRILRSETRRTASRRVQCASSPQRSSWDACLCRRSRVAAAMTHRGRTARSRRAA